MSSRKRRVLLTSEAEEDHESILLYGAAEWGDHQAARYRDALDRAFESLALFPRMGRARDEIFPGCRVCRVRKHLLVYRIDRDVITIMRILHVRQDIEREFEDFEG